MHRFKTLIILVLLVAILFIVGLNLFVTFDNRSAKVEPSMASLQKSQIDEKELEQYLLRQQELKVSLKTYFDKAIASGDIVGAGVSIVKGDSVVVSNGFGKRNINSNIGVDGETVFRLGSLSKGFTGVLAATLKQDGKLNWEDHVSDYIPGFQLGDLNNTNKITLANILSHTSGTPYHCYTNLVEAGLPLEDIAKRFKNVTPISTPGTMYSYQNAMFALSGEMMRKVTGEDINTLLKERLFNPLEMCSTSMDYETLMHTENVAKPNSRSRKGWRSLKLTDNYCNAVAAGGINASASDMSKWMRFLLGNNPEIMSKSDLNAFFKPYIEIKGGSKYYQRWPGHLSSYYGFGWRIHKFLDDDSHLERTIWHHGGSVNNFRNEIAIYPEANIGICVLLNSNSKLARTVIPDLYKMVNEIYNPLPVKMAQNHSLSDNPAL